MKVMRIGVIFVSVAIPVYAQTSNQEMIKLAEASANAERVGNFTEAVEGYQKLAALLPRNAEILSNLGVALYFNGELNECISVFHKAISLNPHLLSPHLFTGLAFYMLSRPDSAVPQLQEAVRIAPSDAIARTWLGYAYRGLGQDKAALAEFEVVARLKPDDPNAWYELGQTWLHVGEDDTRRLLAVAPNGGRVWELAGEQCLDLGQSENALRDFEHAEALRPDIPELPVLIEKSGGRAGPTPTRPAPGRLAPEHRLTDELYDEVYEAEVKSQASFERVFQLAPNSYWAHEIMASIYMAKQQYGKAVSEYRIVLKLKPDLRNIHESLGNALVRADELPDALKELKKEVALEPHSAIANMSAGRVLVMMGDDPAAKKYLNAALTMDFPPPETHFLLGKIAFQNLHYRSAISQLQQFISTVKGNASAYYLLAMSYRNLGLRNQMRKYLALYKKSQSAIQYREIAQETGGANASGE